MATINITFNDLIRHLSLGDPQVAGNMVVLPLLTLQVAEEITTDYRVSVATYGTVDIKNNKSDKVALVPANTIYKGNGQDHAIVRPHLVKDSKRDTTAACVQSSVGGHIHNAELTAFLPVAVRRTALINRNLNKFSKLWTSLSAYNRAQNISNRGDMQNWTVWYNELAEDMDQFAAQFELVQEQVGAMVFINGSFYGLEIYPNHETWQAIWRKLLRDAYATEARRLGFQPNEYKWTFNPGAHDTLQEAVNGTRKSIMRAARQAYASFGNTPITVEETTQDQGVTFENSYMEGDLILRGNQPLYVSIFRVHDEENEIVDIMLD